MKVLNLSKNDIGDEGMNSLCNSPNLMNLSKLYIDENKLSLVGAEYFAKSEFLKHV
jgi:hypothetical protein